MTALVLTREQRKALKAVYDRHQAEDILKPTYREFRRTVRPEICGSAVLVCWAGMWIGIEPDGYTHT